MLFLTTLNIFLVHLLYACFSKSISFLITSADFGVPIVQWRLEYLVDWSIFAPSFSHSQKFLSLFICIQQSLQWILELLALPCLAYVQFFSASNCLPACLPSWYYPCVLRYWWFLFVHPEHLFNIIRMHYTIVISSLPEPSRSSILTFHKNPDISHLCVLYNIKSFYKTKNECLASHSSAFLVYSDFSIFFIHLLIVTSSFICVTSHCFYLSWNSYSLLSLSEELLEYFFEAVPNPFMVTTSSSLVLLSASLFQNLSHGSWTCVVWFLLAPRNTTSSSSCSCSQPSPLSDVLWLLVVTVSQNLAW